MQRYALQAATPRTQPTHSPARVIVCAALPYIRAATPFYPGCGFRRMQALDGHCVASPRGCLLVSIYPSIHLSRPLRQCEAKLTALANLSRARGAADGQTDRQGPQHAPPHAQPHELPHVHAHDLKRS